MLLSSSIFESNAMRCWLYVRCWKLDTGITLVTGSVGAYLSRIQHPPYYRIHRWILGIFIHIYHPPFVECVFFSRLVRREEIHFYHCGGSSQIRLADSGWYGAVVCRQTNTNGLIFCGRWHNTGAWKSHNKNEEREKKRAKSMYFVVDAKVLRVTYV